MITYKKGDVLSEAPKDGILVHSCNCRGVWGGGIAVQIKDKWPDAFAKYKFICDSNIAIPGEYLILAGEPHILCLLTSNGYGKFKDTREVILENTKKSLNSFMERYKDYPLSLHSPKINSGLFGVPWELTEKVIDNIVKPPNSWTVWEL
jgi:ADP-ribose 1''-phosphate phosphatase